MTKTKTRHALHELNARRRARNGSRPRARKPRREEISLAIHELRIWISCIPRLVRPEYRDKETARAERELNDLIKYKKRRWK